MAMSKKKIGIIVLVALVIAAVAAVPVIHSIMVQRITAKLHDEFGDAAKFDTISTTLMPPGAIFRNLRFATASAPDAPVIQIESLNLALTSAVLFGQPVHVTDAQARGVRLNVVHEAGGESNFKRFARELPPTNRKVDIPVDKLSFDEILITETRVDDGAEPAAAKDDNIIKISGISLGRVLLPPRGKPGTHPQWESLAIEKISASSRAKAQPASDADAAAIWLSLGPTTISASASPITLTLNSIRIGKPDPAAANQPLFASDTLKISILSDILDGGDLHIVDASIPGLTVHFSIDANGDSSFTRFSKVLPHASRASDLDIDKLVLDNLRVVAGVSENSETTFVNVKNLTGRNIVIPPSGKSVALPGWESITVADVEVVKPAAQNGAAKATDRRLAHLEKATFSASASPIAILLDKLQLGCVDGAAAGQPLFSADTLKLSLTPESADGHAIHLTEAALHGLNIHFAVDAQGESSLTRFLRELPHSNRAGEIPIDKILLDGAAIALFTAAEQGGSATIPDSLIKIKSAAAANVVIPPSGKSQTHPGWKSIAVEDVEILKPSASQDGANATVRKWGHLDKITVSASEGPIGILLDKLQLGDADAAAAGQPLLSAAALKLTLAPEPAPGIAVHVTEAALQGLDVHLSIDAQGQSSLTRFIHELPHSNRAGEIPIDKLVLDGAAISTFTAKEQGGSTSHADSIIKVKSATAANVLIPPSAKTAARPSWESIAVDDVEILRPSDQNADGKGTDRKWAHLSKATVSASASPLAVTLNKFQVGYLDAAAGNQPLISAGSLKFALAPETVDGASIHFTEAAVCGLDVHVSIDAQGETSVTRFVREMPHSQRAAEIPIDKLLLNDVAITAFVSNAQGTAPAAAEALIKVKSISAANVLIPPSDQPGSHPGWKSIAVENLDVSNPSVQNGAEKATDIKWAHLDKATISASGSPFAIMLDKLQLGFADAAASGGPLLSTDALKLTLAPESADGKTIHLTEAALQGLDVRYLVDAQGESSLTRFLRELPHSHRAGEIPIDKILLTDVAVSTFVAKDQGGSSARLDSLIKVNSAAVTHLVVPPAGKSATLPAWDSIVVANVEVSKPSSRSGDGKATDRKWAHVDKATLSASAAPLGVILDNLQLGDVDAAAGGRPLLSADALKLTLTRESADGRALHVTDAAVRNIAMNISVDARGESSFSRFMRELPHSERATEIPIDKLLLDGVAVSTFVAKEQGGFGSSQSADSVIQVKSVSAANYIIPPSGKLLDHEQWTAVTLEEINTFAPYPEQREITPCIRIPRTRFELLQAPSTHDPVRLKHFTVEQSSSITDYTQATLPISRAVTAIQQGFGVKEPKEIHDSAPDNPAPHGTGVTIEDLNLANTRIETIGIDGAGKQAYWTLSNATISGTQLAFGADNKNSSTGNFQIDSATESSSGPGHLRLRVANLTGSYPNLNFACDYQIENLAAPVFSSKAQKADGAGIVAGSMTMAFTGGAAQGQLDIQGAVTLSDDFEITGGAVKRLGIKIMKGKPIEPVTITGPLTRPQIKMPSELAFLRGMMGNVIFAGPVAILDTVADNTPIVGPAMKEAAKGLKLLGKIPDLFK